MVLNQAAAVAAHMNEIPRQHPNVSGRNWSLSWRNLGLLAVFAAGVIYVAKTHRQPEPTANSRFGSLPVHERRPTAERKTSGQQDSGVLGSSALGSTADTLSDKPAPLLVLHRIADDLLNGPPTIVEFRGQTNLEVALRPLKSLRGQTTVLPLAGTFANLGQGSGLAKWQMDVGSPVSATVLCFNQQRQTVIYSTAPGASQGVVAAQPVWLTSVEDSENPLQAGANSLYGSPVSLIQWLPHRFDCSWGSVHEWPGEIHRLAPSENVLGESPTNSELTIVGRLRSKVASEYGIELPAGFDTENRAASDVNWPGFAAWARHVPVPAPHLVEIQLRRETDGAIRLSGVTFFRIHPLRPELEEMVRLEWGAWRAAPELRAQDVMVRTGNP